jgi:hypothetical protein
MWYIWITLKRAMLFYRQESRTIEPTSHDPDGQTTSITANGYIPWPWKVASLAAAEVYGNVGSWGWEAFGTQVGFGDRFGKYADLEWSYNLNVDHRGPTW